jgi:hypothetical protein
MFSPLFFLVGAMPGAEGAIFAWFKRVAASLIAFPAVAFFVKLAFAVGFSGFGQIDLISVGGAGEVPALGVLEGPAQGLFGWVFAAPVIGFGLFFFATKVPDIVDELMGIKPLGARAGIGAGAALAAPLAVAGVGGRVARSLDNARGLAVGFAQSGTGWRQSIARTALQFPGIGDPRSRYLAGVASPTDEIRLQEAVEREAKIRQGKVRQAEDTAAAAPVIPPAPTGIPTDDRTASGKKTRSENY